MPFPRIAIVGAGLGGLTCARVLQRHGRDVTVLEREPDPDARQQGGTLDMHLTSGQVALERAGLLAAFRALARPEGQELRSLDPWTGALLMHERPEPGELGRPEIDRGQLRGLLLDSLVAGTVRWGCPVADARALGAEFDLVIGADGAWSRVRPAVSAAVPEYTGVTFVEFTLPDADRTRPELARLVGQGTMTAKVDGAGLFLQRNDGGLLRGYAALRVERAWAARAGLDLSDPAAVLAHLLTRFDGWHPPLLDLLRHHVGPFVERPLYALPVPHEWPHTSGYTLLGDAAHLMPPLGVGANLAMLDGAELAEALATDPDPDAAVAGYEAVMLPRSARIAAAVRQGLRELMSGGVLEPAAQSEMSP